MDSIGNYPKILLATSDGELSIVLTETFEKEVISHSNMTSGLKP